MTDFKKWFAARARNPDRITLEEAFNADIIRALMRDSHRRKLS